jgi:hypothetical protein
VAGNLEPGGIQRYMLRAGAGQQMTVKLSAGDPTPGAILVIWGADGTVLISDHADATYWVGELPATQDYIIDVKSISQNVTSYTMEVIIPPKPEDSQETEVLPLDVPVGFEFLFGLGEPLMLPPDFPVETGLPAVQPYVMAVESGEYEISLDFGSECQGAGACHYGSMAGKAVGSGGPVSTRNILFEPERAQPVTLFYGIQGYFIEAQCGATCDDAKLFWIYDGYQFVLGLKAGQRSNLIDLANAAIVNSVR